MQPLAGMLVVDLTRYLPGAFASRELLRLGARVVRLEPPEGDPMRQVAPAWEAALNAGKESVACDLKADPGFGRALCAHADVVLEGFRPGVAARLGVGPEYLPDRIVYCSITGFGTEDPHAQRAGHDLNYLGWAGVLEDTAPSLPPLQPADLAAGALGAVTEILAALLERERTGNGARLTISMTHGSHRLVAHRLALDGTSGDPLPRFLTGGIACYGIYSTADGRHVTVAALEPKFFVRLCEVIGRPDLAELHLVADAQKLLTAELAAVFATRRLDEWLRLCANEDVALGPVATLAEAAAEFGEQPFGAAPAIGEHTAAWQKELELV
ncbi:MAG: CoA transferase [Actinobacteria bacterium]|nr:CoA transferase [Actinomycetota bacterium]